MKSLDTTSLEQTNQNLIKVPTVLSQRVRKHGHKTLGTSVIFNVHSLPLFHVVRPDKNLQAANVSSR